MKKSIIAISALSLLLLTQCKKALEQDPKGQLVGTDAVSTLPGLQAAVLGAYQPLKNGYTSGFASSAIVGLVMGSDDLTTHPASNKQDFREIDQFAASNTNGRTPIIWLGCYKTIININNILTAYKNTSGNSAAVNQLLGEAYFLRAFSYFWLVRFWNNIPLITASSYDAGLLSITKSPATDVYKLIEADLQQAEQLLPNAKPAAGRAGAGAAKALLAEVYLMEGGYPINDQSKYALAAAKAKEVISNKALYGFDLAPDLNVLWSGTQTAINTPEAVFELEFSSASGNGNSIYGKSAMPGDENGWDDYFCEINFFNNFPAGKRKDATFHTTFIMPAGNINWQNGQTKHPYYQKFRVNTPTPNYLTSSTNQPLPLIRYAHVLLTFAEADARANNAVSADDYAAVNAIRSRAGLAPLNGLSANDFESAVVQERAWEFAGEYTRWFDLVRLQMVESANANKNTNDLKPIGAITKANYFLPIPNADLQLNPNLSFK
ncbi:RagB/SusD family nutrient uptake outer membrane protein [Pedobacter jeongneungensis]|uniref:RagB/SusD family nutrient uptake outer membrane protein n=1 Tax=Pedobacter jeongneungensis TaxID=947309 RepID=UPI00046A511B|nr:RagB/SusD family nutrient uptake outer membrane protein [Pedobacter jeongneungensis]